MRAMYNEYMNVYTTSVAVVTHAFTPLLHRSPAPKVINITSGLSSITNVLSPRHMVHVPPYGASKVGMNGLTAHLQVGENERVVVGDAKPCICFFISNPGLLEDLLLQLHCLGEGAAGWRGEYRAADRRRGWQV